jgi:hypothetical protein
MVSVDGVSQEESSAPLRAAELSAGYFALNWLFRHRNKRNSSSIVVRSVAQFLGEGALRFFGEPTDL